MAVFKKLRSLPSKKKIEIVAVAGIIVTGVVVAIALSTMTYTTSPPGAFTLLSNAGSPDPDGRFTLSWTPASQADTYTVYRHNSRISEINGSVMWYGGAWGLSRLITDTPCGVYYYVVVAANGLGSTMSNCIEVFSGWHAWTWMGGNSTLNLHGVYGTKNTPAPGNFPGARSGGNTWTDQAGDLWLFGGYGYGESGTQGQLQDLWRYNVTSLEWTWINGSKVVRTDPVWGEKGTPDPANWPCCRSGSATWVDQAGDLWLYGGQGYLNPSQVDCNDVWRFNMTSREWTWMSGNSTTDTHGHYGTKGVPDAANYPASRSYSGFCSDASGNLWVFGGFGYNGTGSYGRLDETWRFNAATCTWTWVNGSGAIDRYGIYGTKGTASGSNNPGGRYSCTTWLDTSGDMWLFGGSGYGESGSSGFLNDVWRFDTASSRWTWMNGSKLVDQHALFNPLGLPHPSNTPGSRSKAVSWVGAGDSLWLFAGIGHNNTGPAGVLNDVWRFNTTSIEWTWMGGSQALGSSGIYGEMYTPNASNIPGARQYNTFWTGAGGEAWVFGGFGTAGYFSDMWRYFP